MPRVHSFSVLCFPTGATHITSDMCSGKHISRGNTYHCDIGTAIWYVSILERVRNSGAREKKIENVFVGFTVEENT